MVETQKQAQGVFAQVRPPRRDPSQWEPGESVERAKPPARIVEVETEVEIPNQYITEGNNKQALTADGDAAGAGVVEMRGTEASEV